MLTWEACVEAHALRQQGWTVTAIANHLGVARATVRGYLNGDRVPGQRARSVPDPFEAYVEFCRLRLAGDPHLWATTLFEEVVELGYVGSYPSFTRGLRAKSLRPRCGACASARGIDRGLIEHPAGAETQFDWVELPDPPPAWGWGKHAHLLVGALAHSSRWRGVLAESEDQPHLIDALHRVSERLGGLSAQWRFDRMASVCDPGSGRLHPSFAAVAVHYQVAVAICPSRHGWRKGVVEKANHSAAQRWWRTVADDASILGAQAGLDRLSVRLDGRRRMCDGTATTVGALADAERLAPLPGPYPATLQTRPTVSAQALVSFRGNFYSVPPGHAGTQLLARHRLGTTTVEVLTAGGTVLARHRRQPDGAGVIERAEIHVAALERVLLADFAQAAPCRVKTRRPASPAARAEADRIRAARGGRTGPAAGDVVVDFAAYADAVRPLRPSTAAGKVPQ